MHLCNKEMLFTRLKPVADKLCVVQEHNANWINGCDQDDPGHGELSAHLHIAIRTSRSYRFSEFASLFILCTRHPFPVDVRGVRSWPSAIRYLTKEDLDPYLYNIHLSDCSFSFNLKLFCKQTFNCVNFPSSDYFVTNHFNKINCFRSDWMDYHSRYFCQKKCVHIVSIVGYWNHVYVSVIVLCISSDVICCQKLIVCLSRVLQVLAKVKLFNNILKCLF